ncbi:helix-turn-helix domain-containing protein [Lentibacillus jeotgali]|uniref:helix-turn-helix domain-containing protein n=1 Tax=Lentibacillus jeotgali TaxID=558169 RepID=UPI0002628812|nr:XRE family transcriptional regulator [Lentibacillus jeotgali]
MYRTRRKGRVTIDLQNIGQKLKQARLKSKHTQQQIADQCGISKSLLSKIENGQTSSAVATLSKISEALGVPLSWVLDGHPETDLVMLPKMERKISADDENMGYSLELLANRSRFSRIEPTIVHVTPKDYNVRNEPYTHSQDEFIYIVEGSIELYYDGEKHYMEKGDTGYFKGIKPHLFIPVDNDGAKVLAVFIDE